MPPQSQDWHTQPTTLPMYGPSAAGYDDSTDSVAGRRRVLHVINGEHYSGAERVQDLLATRLSSHGFDVGFACVKPDRFPAARTATEAPLFRLPMAGRFDVRVIGRLVEMLRSEHYELIHAHTPRTALVGQKAARRTGLPLVYHVHSPATRDSTRRMQDWANALVERWNVRHADRLICVSPSLAQYMADRGFPADAIVYVPNGVPSVAQATIRRPPHGSWTLGSVALFRPRKGLEILLQALASLISHGFNVRLRAIGAFETSDYESAIMCLTERLGIAGAVDWMGFCGDVPSELARIDLFALPSLFGEGLPMVVLEAMAMGIPVVATCVEGVPEAVIHRETGVLVEPNSVSQLANAIARIVEGELDYGALSAASLARHAAKFSDSAMAEGVARVYREVLARWQPGE